MDIVIYDVFKRRWPSSKSAHQRPMTRKMRREMKAHTNRALLKKLKKTLSGVLVVMLFAASVCAMIFLVRGIQKSRAEIRARQTSVKQERPADMIYKKRNGAVVLLWREK